MTLYGVKMPPEPNNPRQYQARAPIVSEKRDCAFGANVE